MKVVLELQGQSSSVKKITISHDIVIGRGSDCNLKLVAPLISRRHCFLRIKETSASITDLGSSNGTFINGQQLEANKRYKLKEWMKLTIGGVKFLVKVRADAADVKAITAAKKIKAEKTGDSAATVAATKKPNSKQSASKQANAGPAKSPTADAVSKAASSLDRIATDDDDALSVLNGDDSESKSLPADKAAAKPDQMSAGRPGSGATAAREKVANAEAKAVARKKTETEETAAKKDAVPKAGKRSTPADAKATPADKQKSASGKPEAKSPTKSGAEKAGAAGKTGKDKERISVDGDDLLTPAAAVAGVAAVTAATEDDFPWFG